VPRLASTDPFFLLDPRRLADGPRAATSIRGASRSAQTVDVGDLELAVVADAGLGDRRTVIATTVLRCARPHGWELPRLDPSDLPAEKIAAIPLLQRLGRADPRSSTPYRAS